MLLSARSLPLIKMLEFISMWIHSSMVQSRTAADGALVRSRMIFQPGPSAHLYLPAHTRVASGRRRVVCNRLRRDRYQSIRRAWPTDDADPGFAEKRGRDSRGMKASGCLPPMSLAQFAFQNALVRNQLPRQNTKSARRNIPGPLTSAT